MTKVRASARWWWYHNKVRWDDERRSKGNRGGLRLIYLYIPENDRILMLHLYDKNENSDFSAQDKQVLRLLAEEYRETLAQRGQRR